MQEKEHLALCISSVFGQNHGKESLLENALVWPLICPVLFLRINPLVMELLGQ